jgi:hypothetical protein
MPSDVVEQYQIPVLGVIHKYNLTNDIEGISIKCYSDLGLIQEEVSDCVKLLLEKELLAIDPGSDSNSQYHITEKGLSELENYNKFLLNP